MAAVRPCSQGTRCGSGNCQLSWNATLLFAILSVMSWSAVSACSDCQIRVGEKLSSDCRQCLKSICVNLTTNLTNQDCRSWVIDVFGGMVALSMRTCQERSRLASLDDSLIRVLVPKHAPVKSKQFPYLLSILAYLQNRTQDSMYSTYKPGKMEDLLNFTGVDERRSTILVDALPRSQLSDERTLAVRRYVRNGGTLVTLKSSFRLANALYDQHSLNRTTIPHEWRRRRDGVMVVLKKSKHRYSTDHRRSAVGTCAGDEDMFRVWRWYTERKTPSYWPVGNDTLLVQKSVGLSAKPTRLHSLLRVAKYSQHLSVLVCYDVQRGSVFHVSGDVRHAQHRRRARKRLRDGLFWLLKAQFKNEFKRFWRNYTWRGHHYEAAQPLNEMAYVAKILRITDREIQSAAMASDMVLGMLLKNWKNGNSSQAPCSE